MKQLRLETALAAMQVSLDMDFHNQLKNMGFHEPDWKLLVGSKPWLNDEKHRVKKLIETLISKNMDKLGLGAGILVPSEYVAANICLYVHPANYFAACFWVPNHAANHDLANFQGLPEQEIGMEKTTPQQLFALVLELRSEERVDELAASFCHKTNKQLGIPINEEPKLPKKPEES